MRIPCNKNRREHANLVTSCIISVLVNESILTLEGMKAGGHFDPPPHPFEFLALNFFTLTDYQKPWHNCSLFVKTSFDPN